MATRKLHRAWSDADRALCGVPRSETPDPSAALCKRCAALEKRALTDFSVWLVNATVTALTPPTGGREEES